MSSEGLSRRNILLALSAGAVSLAGCTDDTDTATDSTVPDSFLGETASDQSGEPPVWNVESHGIEGDGETAVGQAVHDLLETVAEAGGGVVYFPPGRYRLERTPLVGEATTVLGAGHGTVFEGVRPDGKAGRALFSNRGYDEPGYGGASNWSVRDVRIDAPESNGIMPAHAENVRLESIYGDAIYHHHVDVVSCKNVVVDGFWASRGGESDAAAPVQFDTQQSGTSWNGIWDGETATLVEDDDTPTRNCTLTNFDIDPANEPDYGVHVHRGDHESITVSDGFVTGCQYTAIRADPDEIVDDLTITGVSCLENARGITLGHVDGGRRALTISDVTIRTDDADVAGGSGLYAAGFDGAGLSSVTVDGEFTNGVLVDDTTDLQIQSVTSRGATDQAFRFRENVDATLTSAHAADCGGAGIYVGPESSVAYGGVTFEDVGSEVVADGDIRTWTTSDASS